MEYKLRKGLGNDKILQANALHYEVHLKEQEAIALMEAVIERKLLNFKYKKIMGEKSKKIGEYGEDYAEKFFNSVGWDSLSKGIELKCSNELHQNKNGNPSRTHGIVLS